MAADNSPQVDVASVGQKLATVDDIRSKIQAKVEEINSLFGQLSAVVPTAAAPTVERGKKVERIPRGNLRDAIRAALAGGKVCSPAEVTKSVAARPEMKGRDSKSLYTSVYVSLHRDKQIRKTPEGFHLMTAGAK